MGQYKASLTRTNVYGKYAFRAKKSVDECTRSSRVCLYYYQYDIMDNRNKSHFHLSKMMKPTQERKWKGDILSPLRDGQEMVSVIPDPDLPCYDVWMVSGWWRAAMLADNGRLMESQASVK